MGLLFSSGKRDFCDDRLPCGALHGPANYERAKNALLGGAFAAIVVAEPTIPLSLSVVMCSSSHRLRLPDVQANDTEIKDSGSRSLAGAQGSVGRWRRWFGREG